MSNVVKNKKAKAKVKKKIDKQKVFWAISIAFLFSCVFFYGGRLIYYYGQFHVSEEESNTLYQVVLDDNYDEDYFNDINGNYYFTDSDVDNYVRYSNMLFRIVKLDGNNNIVLISDKAVSSLAIGENKLFKESYIYEWLNDTEQDNTGIFFNNLNKANNYLDYSDICLDTVDKAKSEICQDIDNDSYVSLLSVTDYINTGSVNGFVNNGEYFYLSDNDSDKGIWYVSDEGKIGVSDGTDMYGIRPVITLKGDLELIGGNGSYDNPYVIEEDNSIFGSYVKLGDDIWRIYKYNDSEYKLILDDYLIVDDEKLSYVYSDDNYKFDSSQYGSLAYYLNNTYLNGLSYKDIIVESNYSNGYYEKDDYKDMISSYVLAKVAIPSVGDMFINNDLSGYFTSTGSSSSGKMLYIVRDTGRFVTSTIGNDNYVVPCITIKKDSIVSGDGSIDNPYGLE